MMGGPTIIQTRAVQVGHNPMHCICPQCHQQIVSRVDYVCINATKDLKSFLHSLHRILVHLHGLCAYYLQLWGRPMLFFFFIPSNRYCICF